MMPLRALAPNTLPAAAPAWQGTAAPVVRSSRAMAGAVPRAPRAPP